MKAVLQRVSSASVKVDGSIVGSIAHGWLILLGITHDDGDQACRFVADKVSGLRVFSDEQGKMNLNIKQVEGSALVISQFTLYGNCQKGRRPSFGDAANPDKARILYEKFVEELKGLGIKVATGEFGAHMEVSLQGDGPVTLILST
ncbi:MAG: D-tyrosyl-tRNA(Tyr) deacylase [Oligoflexales bacterium]|nr:D-tyrosyl-tRNA(Tyr) deacylase [Oligoflexales bacterium]